jgi:anti-sigma-K factor RskA
MARDEHSLLRENLPAYALGVLDVEEARALEAHLRTCQACQAELAEYRAMSEHLVAALPPRQPSPALRKRLQSQLPSARPMPKAVKPRFAWSFGQLLLGSALVLLFAMNLFSFLQVRDLQRQQLNIQRQLRNNQMALAMLSYSSTELIPIEAGEISGTVLLDWDRNSAALVMWNLPELSENQTYQVWLIEGDEDRVSGGLFRPQAGLPYTTQPIYTKQALLNFVGIGVTIEPAGGSERPTGPRVLRVDF